VEWFLLKGYEAKMSFDECTKVLWEDLKMAAVRERRTSV
jgi:hypothetical protein